MRKRQPNAGKVAVKRLALSTGLLVALFVFGVVANGAVTAGRSSAVTPAQNGAATAAHNSAATAAHNSAATAAQNGAATAAQSDSGLKVQDRSHDNDNPDNTLYALYQIINTGTVSVPLSSLTMRYWF